MCNLHLISTLLWLRHLLGREIEELTGRLEESGIHWSPDIFDTDYADGADYVDREA